tara:strand:+ start:1312 stop:1566 length:255 start_codon:yes stop_codon:yes gene_type:complete
MCDNILSTSNCGTEGAIAFGFGPVTPEGFGLGYMIQPEHVMAYITSFNHNSKEKAEVGYTVDILSRINIFINSPSLFANQLGRY